MLILNQTNSKQSPEFISKISLWTFVILACFGTRGYADTTITFKLPPSKANITAAKARLDAERQVEMQRNYNKQLSSRGDQPPRSDVGRLAEIITNTVIHRNPNVNSRELCEVSAGTDVAVNSRRNGWVGILMQDGSSGWLPTQALQMMHEDAVLSALSMPDSPGPEERDNFPSGSAPFFHGNPQQLVTVAESFLGVPYEWGGNTHKGIDCSGFVKRVFGALGYDLPRVADEQIDVGVPVSPDQLICGDRLYFELSRDGSRVKHTGIYLGNGYFIQSSVTGHGVSINKLFGTYWWSIFVCARR